jgi:hypothetical protein
MAKTPKTTTTIQDPWSAQQPYLRDIFGQAQQQFKAPGPYYFGDTAAGGIGASTIAEQSAATTEGQQRMLDYARGGATDLAGKNIGAVSDILSGKYLSAESNPYLASYTQAALRPISQQFTESVLPNIRSEALSTGGFGGSRQGVSEGLASGRFAQAIGDTTSNIYNSAYNRGMDQFSRAIDQTPQALAAGGIPASLIQEVGGAQDVRAQRLRDAEVAKWNYYQNLPQQKLAQYLQMISGNYGGATTTPNAQPNPFLGALGGAASGAAVGAPFFGASVPGALIGGILGAAGSR